MQHRAFFVTGGKTGGHIYPAVSVCRELLACGEKIYYVGNKKNLEYSVCEREGFDFLSLDMDAMPRKNPFKFIFWGIKSILACLKAARYLLKYKPGAVFATGGFVCAPTLFVASILKIPYTLHDCDARPGLVTKAFAKKAASVSIAFRDAQNFIDNKNIKCTGNPIRDNFFKISKAEARAEIGIPHKTTILIMGGSQGAKTVNDAAIGVIEYYRESEDVQIILQTGAKNFDDVKKTLGSVPENALVVPYFNDMAYPLVASDIAVARAGSLSISELCACGLPSILVPYPYSAADHQKYNAKKMEEAGAALYLEDKDCTSETLLKMITDIIQNPNKLATMHSCALAEAKPNAVKEIVKRLMEASVK